MITEVAGIRAGHWTGRGTGVTVVLAPSGCVGAGEVRGGSPATREGALLQHGSLHDRVDALVLSGGSAFGLATADGVVGFLAERGQGFPTRAGPVPIVGAACIFDLAVAEGPPPGPVEGRAAAEAAERGEELETGRVGAAAGATVGKWRGVEHGVPGGLGSASARDGKTVVAALAVVNAVGDVVDADGTLLAGSTAPAGTPAYPGIDDAVSPFENTTLSVVATNARLSKVECQLLSQSAHDGLARAIHPPHTRFDGDVAFALATGEVAGDTDRIRVMAVDVVAQAIRDAVRSMRSR